MPENDYYNKAQGYSSRFSPDSKMIGAATAQLRSYVQTNVYDGSAHEIDRVTKYYLYWNYYEGKHYREYNDAMLSFNYVRAFIDKVVMFLLGRDAFTFHVQDLLSEQVDSEFEKWAEKALMYNWNKSKKLITTYELLQMGSICGDAWIGAQWDEEGKYVRIRVFDSRQCFPQFENGDIDKMSSFILRFSLAPNKDDFKLRCFEYTKEKINSWFQKDAGDSSKSKRYLEKSDPNPYGFIPVVHIKNKPFSPGYYSKSDAADILKINKIYNEMMQQEKTIMDYHATPTTVITGANGKGLQRGLGKIWSGLPPEANVFNLGLDVDMSAMDNYLKTLKMSMHELSDVPENALGKIQAISNTSAAALTITYQPLVQQADLKGITYGEGITELNTMVIKIHRYHDDAFQPYLEMEKQKPNFIDTIRVVPVFSYGFPQDRQNELNMGLAEIQAGIGSKREVMERLGKNNVPELLEEIDNEKLNDADVEAQAQDILGLNDIPNNGQPGGNQSKKPSKKPSNGKQPGAVQ